MAFKSAEALTGGMLSTSLFCIIGSRYGKICIWLSYEKELNAPIIESTGKFLNTSATSAGCNLWLLLLLNNAIMLSRNNFCVISFIFITTLDKSFYNWFRETNIKPCLFCLLKNF